MSRNSKEIAIMIPAGSDGRGRRDVRPEAASNVSREPDAARLGAGSSTMGQGGIEGGVRDGRCR